jgi:hypothetical protein
MILSTEFNSLVTLLAVMLVLMLQVVAEGEATLVFLDSSYRPVRVPAAVKGVFTQLAKEYKAAAAAVSSSRSQTAV